MIQGDTLIRCFHANTANILGKHLVQMFHFTFNTDFFHKNVSASRHAHSKRFLDSTNVAP